MVQVTNKDVAATGVDLTVEQKKRRRNRSIALAAGLVGFVILFYVITIVKLGPAIMDRPL